MCLVVRQWQCLNTNDKAGSDIVNNFSSSNFHSFFIDSVKEVRDVAINSIMSKGGSSGNNFLYKHQILRFQSKMLRLKKFIKQSFP